MNIVPKIAGKSLRLRPVVPEDAAFIQGLRTDSAYNTHLSPVTGTVADQRDWIIAYKAREAVGEEIYYIIERLDGVPCGVVRLYDIAADRFTWGSWILNADKPPKAALESALLSFSVGFMSLGLSRADIDVRKANEKAIDFYRRFGMLEIGRASYNYYFEQSRAQITRLRDPLCEKLEA